MTPRHRSATASGRGPISAGDAPAPAAPLALGASVVLLALNLRTVVASLPPLLPQVRHDLQLSASAAGALTTAPVLALALLAPLGRRLGRRLGLERVLVASLALTAVAAAVRAVAGVAGLATGMVLGGVAVALGQSAVPPLVRLRCQGATGVLTGAYAMALLLGATLAAALAVPLRDVAGWRCSLAAWAVPALLAAVVWARQGDARTRPPRLSDAPRPAHSLTAWGAALFFGLQSALFFAQVAWLPTILAAAGTPSASAGRLQALGTLVAAPVAVLVLVAAARHRTQVAELAVVSATWTAGLLGLLLLPAGAATACMVLVGVGQGSGLGLALALPGLKGGDAAEVAALTAFILLVGYLVGACGGLALGVVHDLSGSWDVALLVLAVVAAAQFAPGLVAARAVRPAPAGTGLGARR